MKDQLLEIEVAIQILKPRDQVFEAIVDPVKMSGYFIALGSGRMETGKEVFWKFPEIDMQVPIRVITTIKDKYISYHWDGEDGSELLVEITLDEGKNNTTIVKITEKSMANNEAGINWLKGNTEGWANFLACLKAYAEHGINLRNGAFDFRFEK